MRHNHADFALRFGANVKDCRDTCGHLTGWLKNVMCRRGHSVGK